MENTERIPTVYSSKSQVPLTLSNWLYIVSSGSAVGKEVGKEYSV